MASLIAILDLKGKPLIQRSYRDDVPSSYIERFLPIVLDLEEEGQQVAPCFSREGVNYMHIRHSNLYRESCIPVCTAVLLGRTATSCYEHLATVSGRGALGCRWRLTPSRWARASQLLPMPRAVFVSSYAALRRLPFESRSGQGLSPNAFWPGDLFARLA